MTTAARHAPAPLGRTFPFSALVGQDRLRRALLTLAVNPDVGGLLVRGEKGTAKSTAVRGLATLLPGLTVIADCPYRCAPDDVQRACADCRARLQAGDTVPTAERPTPVVELPVGATMDRVVGAVDFEHALRAGRRTMAPGVLAEANRGILYVDEINLLDDALANALLDALVTGVNHVEREGVSAWHPARFMLVGTMNPEEGELRPQLLDRFGLCVAVGQLTTVEDRLAVLQRRELFDADPEAFSSSYIEADTRLRARIAAARTLLPRTTMTPRLEHAASAICLMNGVAGHRADLALRACAHALAALAGRTQVEAGDLQEAATLALPHRARSVVDESVHRTLLETVLSGESHTHLRMPDDAAVEGAGTDDYAGGDDAAPGDSHSSGHRAGEAAGRAQSGSATEPGASDAQRAGGTAGVLPGDGHAADRTEDGMLIAAAEAFRVPPLLTGPRRRRPTRAGRRPDARPAVRHGRYVRSRANVDATDLALDATIRAAAPHQRRRESPLAIAIEPADVQEKVREQKSGYLLVFIVDSSGSMGTALMSETKAAMISLLLDAYQRRDRVALVTFAGRRAEVLVPPTNSVEVAQRLLAALPAGGKTPLAHGLVQGYEVVAAALRRSPDLEPWLILLSDGEANVGLHGDTRYDGAGYRLLVSEVLRTAAGIRRDKRVRALVIDTESHQFTLFRDAGGRVSMARRIADALGAGYARLDTLRGERILETVQAHLR